MKILAIGDYHAKFPDKLKEIIIQENPDLILSTGDYAGIEEFRPAIKKMFKELARGKEFSFEDYFGKNKYRKILKKDYELGKIPIKELNNFNIPVLSVFGNGDWYDSELNDLPYNYEKVIKKLKNIIDIDGGSGSIGGVKVVGFGGYLDPDIYFTEKGMRAINTDKENALKRKIRYNDSEKYLMKLMKFNPDILLAHYTPYKCLDKMKERGFLLTGENMGVSSYNRAAKKYKPALIVCGHMHENQGQCKLGKTLVVNPGSAAEGKCAFIEFEDKNKKVLSVRFVR